MRRDKVGIRELHWRWVFPGLLIGMVLLVGWRAATAGGNQLGITYLGVGQGDCALLRGPDGFDILIDGGKTSAGPTVAAYLRAYGVDDIDVLLASHNDADHIGGLVDVLAMDDIPVQQAYFNGYVVDTDIFRAFATAAALEGAPLQALQYPAELGWGALFVRVLGPEASLPAGVSQNDASIVLLVSYGDQDFLFPGDLEAEGEAQVLGRGTPLAAEVLKVAHHGSDSSSGLSFLYAVQPTDAVISVGAVNPFGHPDQAVLDRLEAAGIRTWRTDLNGNIYLSSDGWTYQIWAEVMNPVYLPLVFQNLCNPQVEKPVFIRSIFYNGVIDPYEPDEYVEIANQSNCPIQLLGWRLRDLSSNTYTFPDFVMAPGQVCRVYTNEEHAEWCGFNWHKPISVWNNGGDCGRLLDSTGVRVDEVCYP